MFKEEMETATDTLTKPFRTFVKHPMGITITYPCNCKPTTYKTDSERPKLYTVQISLPLKQNSKFPKKLIPKHENRKKIRKPHRNPDDKTVKKKHDFKILTSSRKSLSSLSAIFIEVKMVTARRDSGKTKANT